MGTIEALNIPQQQCLSFVPPLGFLNKIVVWENIWTHAKYLL